MEEKNIAKDIIRVLIGRDHTFDCDTVVIGRTGEHIISRFEITIPDELCNMWPYLDFKKPKGAKVITERLDIVNGKIEYDIPNGLLDEKGTLEAQLILKKENGGTWKSAGKKFVVLESIDASDEIPEKEDFINEAQNLLDELTEAKENGEFNGKDGKDGKDGVVDYFLVANAIKGKACGNPVALSDVSPLPHEIKVNVDVKGATVQKCGKNLVDVEKMLNAPYFTKDENGVYRLSKGSAKAYKFASPIPANTSIVLSYKNFEGYNANSNALIFHSIYFADGTNEGGNWVGGNWKGGNPFYNFLVIKKEKAITGFNINVYNPSADYHASFTGLQIEIGNTETDFEPFQEPIPCTADENGIVNGVIGNGESMTLIAEDGVTMEAEYNVDTKKYIDKKFDELQALVLEV